MVTAQQPIRMARIGWVCAIAVLALFVVIALVMKQHTAGAHFIGSDQIATVIVGVILGGLFLMLTRPRLRADVSGVHLRSFLGGWRDIPWNLVVRIDFPSNVRFARVVLPAEESLAIYAVSRLDKAAVSSSDGSTAEHTRSGQVVAASQVENA